MWIFIHDSQSLAFDTKAVMGWCDIDTVTYLHLGAIQVHYWHLGAINHPDFTELCKLAVHASPRVYK